jgi:hypothetical protein
VKTEKITVCCELCGAQLTWMSKPFASTPPRLCALCEISHGLDKPVENGGQEPEPSDSCAGQAEPDPSATLPIGTRICDTCGRPSMEPHDLCDDCYAAGLQSAAGAAMVQATSRPKTTKTNLEDPAYYRPGAVLEARQCAGPAPSDPVYRPAHYTQWPIEPFTFLMLNQVPFAEGAVIKYVMRWRKKNGLEDLRKARRILEMMIELEEHAEDYTPRKGCL